MTPLCRSPQPGSKYDKQDHRDTVWLDEACEQNSIFVDEAVRLRVPFDLPVVGFRQFPRDLLHRSFAIAMRPDHLPQQIKFKSPGRLGRQPQQPTALPRLANLHRQSTFGHLAVNQSQRFGCQLLLARHARFDGFAEHFDDDN